MDWQQQISKQEEQQRKKKKKPTTSFTNDESLQRKVEAVCDGLLPNVAALFMELSDTNKKAIAEFILDLVHRKNIAVNTKGIHLKNLVYLTRFWKGMVELQDMKQDHVDGYLQSMRRDKETDPDQRWIATHNNRAMTYTNFFRWLYYPDLEPEQRVKKVKPDVIANITFFKKKSKTNIKPTQLWTAMEDQVFLKYCPDPRVALYHVMADDTSGRPHELLAKRIGDVKVIKTTNNSTYAEMEIGRGGKTRPRIVPLMKSLPYFKTLLQIHPRASDPNAFVFFKRDQRSKYINRPIKPISLNRLYRDLKLKYFPKVLVDRDDVPTDDKAIIKGLLEKPWNPYIQRHSALTEKARVLKEYNLRQYAGWTKTSSMIEIYTHDLGGESSQELLAAYGIIAQADPGREMLQPKYCTNCQEPNKHDARFCANSRCGMPLTFEAYESMKEKQQEKENDIERLKQDMEELRELLKDPKKLQELQKENEQEEDY
jgi:hypothetical protein